MDPASASTARDVRLAVGGHLPEDWDDLSTPMLQLRWASAIAYANRTLAEPPSEAAGAALVALAVALDRRGALLRELPTGDRGQRVAAAAQRLHVTGTIARSVGLPPQLREVARDDAAETVLGVWHDDLSVGDLRVDHGHGWTDRDLAEFIAAAADARREAAEAARQVVAADPQEDAATEPDPLASAVPDRGVVDSGVVDIAIPRPTPDPSTDHAVR